jgi:hypothetical protein
MAGGGKRDRGKERFWRQVVRQWRRSGLTVRAFCGAQGLSEPSFYAWRRIIAERERARPERIPPTGCRWSMLEAWPRLWHSLRASCETDLARQFPLAVVAKWLGNTQAVAMRHYVDVTDADFERALASPEAGSAGAAQNPAQHARAGSCNESQSTRLAHEKTPELPGFAEQCDTVQDGGGGNRTRVPRYFGVGFYVCSRSTVIGRGLAAAPIALAAAFSGLQDPAAANRP